MTHASIKVGFIALTCMMGASAAHADGPRGRGDDRGWPRHERQDDRRRGPNRVILDQQGTNNSNTVAQTGGSNGASTSQNGNNNASAITQAGVNNTGGIRQIGFGNNAGINQTGNENAACIIQIGRRLDGAVVQAGGQSGGILQTRSGTRAVPAEACLLADMAANELKQAVKKAFN
jgi:Curlin associated repeat